MNALRDAMQVLSGSISEVREEQRFKVLLAKGE